jgi:hypothetical protein
MAETTQGANLTAEQRTAQLGNRASALRDVQKLWSTVSPTNLSGTIGTFVDAATAVVRARNRDAAASAAEYLTRFRQAEAGGPERPVRPAPPPSAEQIASKIRGAGLSGIINARRAGMGIDYAGQNGLVKVLGDVATLVISGQRKTVLTAVQDDPVARGWRRITSGSPCAFCSMLAARGPTYKTARSADFEPHGHCGCTAEPVFGTEDPITVVDLAKDFKAATKGTSGKEALAVWRRKLRDPETPSGFGAAGPASPAAPVKPALTFEERLATVVGDEAALAEAPFGLGRKGGRPAEFTDDMARAVNTYTGAEYAAINATLRGLPLPYGYTTEDVAGTISGLEDAFGASKLTADVLAWRGMLNGKGVFGAALDGNLTGFSWLEEGYGSTSALEKRAKNFAGKSGNGVMMRMFIPSGTGAIEASGAQLEAELLLQSKLKATVVADHGVGPDGIRYLDVEVSR